MRIDFFAVKFVAAIGQGTVGREFGEDHYATGLVGPGRPPRITSGRSREPLGDGHRMTGTVADIPNLRQLIQASGSAGRFPRRLHGRQEQCDQNADDGDHHQQLDQRDCVASGVREYDFPPPAFTGIT